LRHAGKYRPEVNMSQTYDKTVDQIMEEYFDTLRKNKKDQFDKADINYYFRKNYPKIKNNTIEYYLARYTINEYYREYYKPKKDFSEDILYRHSSKTFLLYNNGKTFYYHKNYEKIILTRKIFRWMKVLKMKVILRIALWII
jgi:hypothetical protein